ncbi:nitroreductase family protein [Desulfitobacterium metallireducens]|uniref:nitroreductase family protein n=1 Tax=Desulfitobacterium metallireducens TaxID=142877 RepID=UPI0002F0052C|nr:nitroreductase family protein [Desulfitobacterium metallireducens]
MFEIIIDPDQCIGCELCVNDCLTHDLELINNKAVPLHQYCFKCGHCIAICPQQAVSVENYDMSEIKDFEESTFTIEPETFLNVVKFRRSVRHYLDKEVKREKIEKIIEAGRYTETASNSQGVSYIVVQKEIPKLREQATKQLRTLIESGYNSSGLNLDEGDFLFRNAPVLILTVSKSKVDAGLAASNMEIMAVTQGLGAFFIGFFVRIANQDQEIKAILEMKPGEEIITCMAVGYPKIKYYRTVPRKKAKIRWK